MFSKLDLASLLDPEAARDTATGEALDSYKRHTAQIEIVRSDKTMEQVGIVDIALILLLKLSVGCCCSCLKRNDFRDLLNLRLRFRFRQSASSSLRKPRTTSERKPIATRR